MIVAIVTGNLGKDAEIRDTPAGKVCGFDVCSNRKDVATWIRCSVWGDRGVKVAPHLHKGDRVAVCGELCIALIEGKLRLDLRVDQLDFGSPKAPASSGMP